MQQRGSGLTVTVRQEQLRASRCRVGQKEGEQGLHSLRLVRVEGEAERIGAIGVAQQHGIGGGGAFARRARLEPGHKGGQQVEAGALSENRRESVAVV
eukprot:2428657-Prymnesium_polylepis.1